ncbi:uncharacterized protein [Cardiocondyla obscurior]|uniref:uncharacterized protein n=1 Tax=Cardiocondyla obscurior TaxID=286306 RepID=UPI0039656E08
MADRSKFIVQKRVSLKSQITNLANLFDKGKLDNTALKLRLARLTALYHTFEELNDELILLESDDNHQSEFTQVQDRFYALASRIEDHLNAATSSSVNTSTASNDTRPETSVLVLPKRKIKLPDAPLPKFDGKYENWLTFKNNFQNLISSQPDLTNLDKLHYLKSALIDDAANKISVLSVDGINYAEAWILLEKAYEVKRILISRHLSLILNLPTYDKESAQGLSKLADDTQQHLASLKALGVSVGPEMIIHIIENKMPKNTLEKWEASLGRDEIPNLDQLYEFLYKSAVCASKRERVKLNDTEKSKAEPPNKRRKISNQSFMTNVTRNCSVCKTKKHPLYLCDAFKKMTVQQRIDTVKSAKLCYNCMRSHRGTQCKFSNCTICQKRHNTLLHLDNFTSVNKSETNKINATQRD